MRCASLLVFVLLLGNLARAADPPPDALHESVTFALARGEWKAKTDFAKQKEVDGVVVIESMTKYAVITGYVKYGSGPKNPFVGTIDLKKEAMAFTFLTEDGKVAEATGQLSFTRTKAGAITGATGTWKMTPKGVDLKWEWKRVK